MRLRTLGELSLEGATFKRVKPLLLLAYLAVEGTKERWLLRELFWRGATNPQSSLSTALAHLRKAGPGVVDADETKAWCNVESDAMQLLEALEGNENKRAMELYGGAFLAGVDPSVAGVELEEWIYATRELLGSRVRQALLNLAEGHAGVGEFSVAAGLAQRAYLLAGAPEPEPEELERLYVLLRAGEHTEAGEVRKEAAGFGVELNVSVEAARTSLHKDESTSTTEALIGLPVQGTRFVGREHELKEVGELLRQPGCRLVSLVAAGGLGKTRLALQVAQEQLGVDGFPDGAVFVPLEALTSAGSIPAVMAGALGLSLSGQEDAGDVVKRFLAEKRLLLVLDNFEHVLEGASFVRELIDSCPQLKVLITSRERLNLQLEWVFPIGGLAYPEESTTPEGVVDFDAVQLFLQRGRQAQPGFLPTPETLPAVLRICRLVDGMPLAIELATSWLRALPVADIVGELEAGMDLLESPARDVPERHRGVRAVFDHSWALLNEREREVLRRLSVFRGGFRREAAAVVAGASLPMLAGLVDKSLLRMSPGGRYDRHPLLAQYTREKSAEHPEEGVEVEQKHGSYYLGFVRELEPDLWTLERKEAFRVFLEELANIRAAWDWAASNLEVDEIERTTPAMFDFFWFRLSEGLEYFGTTFEFFGGVAEHLDESNPEHAAALGTLLVHQVFRAWIMHRDRDRERERSLTERGVALLESVGEPRTLAKGYHELAGKAGFLDAEAMEGHERALTLARKHRSVSDIGHLLWMMGWDLDLRNTDPAKFERFVEEALGELRELNHLPGVAQFLIFSDSPALILEAYRLAEELEHHEIVINALWNLTRVSVELGEVDQAAGYAQNMYRRVEETGLRYMLPDSLMALAEVALARGDLEGARERLLRAMEIELERGDTRVPNPPGLRLWAELLAAEGGVGLAVALFAYMVEDPLTPNVNHSRANRALSELEGSLTPDEFAAAVERGRTMTLEDVRDELLSF